MPISYIKDIPLRDVLLDARSCARQNGIRLQPYIPHQIPPLPQAVSQRASDAIAELTAGALAYVRAHDIFFYEVSLLPNARMAVHNNRQGLTLEVTHRIRPGFDLMAPPTIYTLLCLSQMEYNFCHAGWHITWRHCTRRAAWYVSPASMAREYDALLIQMSLTGPPRKSRGLKK